MTSIEIAQVLIASGYRKVSNRFLTIARVDNQFVDLPYGADYYRRCNSRDTLSMIPSLVFRLIPTSGHDATGWVVLHPQLQDALTAMKATGWKP